MADESIPVKAITKRKSGSSSKRVRKIPELSSDEGLKLTTNMDKEGILSKDEFRSVYGKISNGKELSSMIPPDLLTLFYKRMSSADVAQQDDNTTITNAFRVYEESDGMIDALKFRSALMTGATRFTEKEVELAFAEMDVINGRIDSNAVIQMILGQPPSSRGQEITDIESEDVEPDEDDA